MPLAKYRWFRLVQVIDRTLQLPSITPRYTRLMSCCYHTPTKYIKFWILLGEFLWSLNQLLGTTSLLVFCMNWYFLVKTKKNILYFFDLFSTTLSSPLKLHPTTHQKQNFKTSIWLPQLRANSWHNTTTKETRRTILILIFKSNYYEVCEWNFSFFNLLSLRRSLAQF